MGASSRPESERHWARYPEGSTRTTLVAMLIFSPNSAVRQGGGRHMEYMVLGTLMNIYFLALAHADLLEG